MKVMKSHCSKRATAPPTGSIQSPGGKGGRLHLLLLHAPTSSSLQPLRAKEGRSSSNVLLLPPGGLQRDDANLRHRLLVSVSMSLHSFTPNIYYSLIHLLSWKSIHVVPPPPSVLCCFCSTCTLDVTQTECNIGDISLEGCFVLLLLFCSGLNMDAIFR